MSGDLEGGARAGEPSDGGGGSPDRDVAIVRTYLDRVHHAVLARGELGGLLRAYLSHAATLDDVPDEGAIAIMRRMLAASTLQLALWPPDQFCSFTLNVADPPCNAFVAGDNNDYQVTGRVFTEDVRAREANRLIVETQRPRLRPARSVVDFEGLDVFEAFHAYWKRAIQARGRLFDLGDDDVVLVQGLPMVLRGWWDALDLTRVRESFDGGLEEIEARTYRFRCGCDVDRITAVVKELFSPSPDELFGEGDVADVQCPRCGRRFTVERRALLG